MSAVYWTYPGVEMCDRCGLAVEDCENGFTGKWDPYREAYDFCFRCAHCGQRDGECGCDGVGDRLYREARES